MRALKVLWRKLSQTKALENASGELEIRFFEMMYRFSYVLGLSTVDNGMLYILYRSLMILSILMLFLSETMYMILDSENLDEVMASLHVMVIQLISFSRFLNSLSYTELYEKLSKSMESENFDISTMERKQIMERWSRVNDNYFKLMLGLGYLTLISWFSFPLLDNVEYNLILGLKIPFNYQNTRDYIFVYLLLLVIFGYISNFVMCIDVKLQTHLLCLICQFNVLANGFENILEDCCNDVTGTATELYKSNSFLYFDKEFQEKYKKRLGGLVKQHRYLLKLVLEFRTSLSKPMLGQLAASTTMICFVGYQVATTITENLTKCIMSMFFLGYNLLNFYIICRWCEEIKTQSEAIGTAVYCCGWEKGAAVIPTVRSTLMLVMARANKPLIMTAGGMYELSLESYASLVKTSYTALTVLLRFRN